MYLKLGNTRLVYEQPTIDDFMIFAQVIDSDMAFERPVVVRTKDQLQVLFGQDFSEKEFLDELLDWGIVLYLTKPVSETEDTWQDGYVDLSKFAIDDSQVYPDYPEEYNSTTIYHIVNQDGYLYTPQGELYGNFIYYEGDFVDIKNLPQNIGGFKTNSLNNRDTLTINKEGAQIQYVNPRYRKNYIILESKNNISLEGLDLRRIKKGYQTMAFRLTIDEDTFQGSPDKTGSYIVIQDRIGIRHLLYYGIKPTIKQKYYNEDAVERFNSLGDLKIMIESLGYFWHEATNMLYSEFPVQTTYFYDIPGFEMVPDYNATHDILSELCEGDEKLRLWSKTIGPGGRDGDIEVMVEKLDDTDDPEYRITLTRFDYSEVFEGYLTEKEDYERLDRQINCGSILAYADFLEDNPGDLPEGTWTLCGAIAESKTPAMYKKSLDLLMSDDIEDNVYPDFLMIPDIHLYGDEMAGGDDSGPEYYSIYTDLLRYAENLGCQVLVQNNVIENEKEDYVYNYTRDVENRLVYFYHGMTVAGEDRPGYYIFLRGLVGDQNSLSTNIAKYDSPLDGKNSYKAELPDLEKKKCNYLIDNNQVYYYKSYFNGNNPETSLWMRFVLGKLSRELEKNRWSYLSERMTGRLKSKIEGVIERVVTSFAIIRQVIVGDYEFDYANSLINLTLDTYISDLVGNHMKLDITINYKKFIKDGNSS